MRALHSCAVRSPLQGSTMWNVNRSWVFSLNRYRSANRGRSNVIWVEILRAPLLHVIFSVFDSWTKFQSGVSYGNAIDFGNFDQCLDFNHDTADESVGLIQGQHCLIYYRATENASTASSDGMFDWSEMWVKKDWCNLTFTDVIVSFN